MHGEKLKICNAQQARINNNYKNIRLKLLKVNSTIWFNKLCRTKGLQPNYIKVSTNGKRNGTGEQSSMSPASG